MRKNPLRVVEFSCKRHCCCTDALGLKELNVLGLL